MSKLPSNCGDCAANVSGECRVLPPQVVPMPAGQVRAAWPLVPDDGWCMLWKPDSTKDPKVSSKG